MTSVKYPSEQLTCFVMGETSIYNCPTFFLFCTFLDDMSYITASLAADTKLHFFTKIIENLSCTVYVKWPREQRKVQETKLLSKTFHEQNNTQHMA